MKYGPAPSRPFRLHRLDDNRLLVARFDDRQSLGKTLARPAAHYEKASELHVKANFVGINMPWEDLVDWYRRVGHFDRLGDAENGSPNSRALPQTGTTEDERLFLLHALWDTSSFNYGADLRDYYVERAPLEPPSYVVAYIDGDDSTLRHELAHALFYLEPSYRTLAQSIWDSLGKEQRAAVESALSGLGYDEVNYLDEMQAYTLEDYRVWTGAFNVKAGKGSPNGTDPFAAASKRLMDDFERFGLEQELRETENVGDRRYRGSQ
jgi:hypothetical protein